MHVRKRDAAAATAAFLTAFELTGSCSIVAVPLHASLQFSLCELRVLW
jgi:hypothetical protein